MSVENRRTLLSAIVALLVGLAIYGVAQGSDLLPTRTEPAPEPAPQEEAPESAALSVAQQGVDIPPGAVMFFNASACPEGWSELTNARGRVVVGLPGGGTLGATVGTALGAQENRAVGQHDHTVSNDDHSHAVNDPRHGHAVTANGHEHDVDDRKHNHGIKTNTDDNEEGRVDVGGTDSDDDGTLHYTDDSRANIFVETGYANISVASAPTGISLNNSTTGVTVDEAGSVSGTNAPYIQLLVCQKD